MVIMIKVVREQLLVLPRRARDHDEGGQGAGDDPPWDGEGDHDEAR
jgi:hypothetical protein